MLPQIQLRDTVTSIEDAVIGAETRDANSAKVRLLDGRDEDKKLLDEEELDELVGYSTNLAFRPTPVGRCCRPKQD